MLFCIAGGAFDAIELFHAPDRVAAVQRLEARLTKGGFSPESLRRMAKGDTAVRNFLEGQPVALVWQGLRLQQVNLPKE